MEWQRLLWSCVLLPQLFSLSWTKSDAFVVRPSSSTGSSSSSSGEWPSRRWSQPHQRTTTPARHRFTLPPRLFSSVGDYDTRNIDSWMEEDDRDDSDVSDAFSTSADADAVPAVLDVDVAIVGAGLGGLCAGAILNTIYHKRVAIFESHYIAGGCAHAFERTIRNTGSTTSAVADTDISSYTLDSGPTILLGCSTQPYNALRQVLNAVNQSIDWIPYTKWGMIERQTLSSQNSNNSSSVAKANETDTLLRWTVELGPNTFEQGPLLQFGGPLAVAEFQALQQATQPLLAGLSIPALAMRSGPTAVVPLMMRHFGTLLDLIQQGDTLTGTFDPFINGPLFTVTSPWLRHWLDALAFSLSGLPASRTAAAAMAFVVNDMHRHQAALDYPRGGMGTIVNALVRAVEQGNHGSKVYLRQHVASIDCDASARRIVGVTLRKHGTKVRARNGVICNAPVWSLRNLITDERVLTKLNDGGIVTALNPQQRPPSSWTTTPQGSSISSTRQKSEHSPALVAKDNDQSQSRSAPPSLLQRCDSAEMTASFMHLHLVVNATGLDDNTISALEAHYTVMDRSLAGDANTVINGVPDGPCGMGNMIAVSNPSVLDDSSGENNVLLIHAYAAGNEPYEQWESLSRNSAAYAALKEERAQPLWRAVEAVLPDVRQRTILSLIGSPLTHERFLRRPRGTYGSATEDYLKDGRTPYAELVLASDGVFPGIGVPSVAIAGASAANSLVSVWDHLQALDRLERQGRLIV